MTSHRKVRLEELIKRVVADTLISEIKDPRIGFVTVTRVELAKDYSSACVFVSILGEEKQARRSIEGLESASMYIQRIVGREIHLRTTPRLRFCLDKSIEEGVNMVNMIENLTSGTKAGNNEDIT